MTVPFFSNVPNRFVKPQTAVVDECVNIPSRSVRVYHSGFFLETPRLEHEVDEWLNANIKGWHHRMCRDDFIDEDGLPTQRHFYFIEFLTDEDAALFKLFWS